MTLRVLLMEDDAAVAAFLRRALTTLGHEVVHASDGAEGLRIYEESEWDLVITDVVMPNVEGLEVIRRVRKRQQAPPIIAISGGGRGSPDTYLGLAAHLGATVVLPKPFTIPELTDAIRRATGPR